jgi:hypothetical protein
MFKRRSEGIEVVSSDCGLTTSHRLNSLEPLKLRVPKIERLITASARVGCTERLRLGPRFKGGTVLPHRV